MKWRLLLSLLLAAACEGPALAGLFGKKPVKPNPIDRVPELIHILKNDSEENKRVEAAEELRQFDPTKFPQIFVALINALQTDPKPAVHPKRPRAWGNCTGEQDGPSGTGACARQGPVHARTLAGAQLPAVLLLGWRL